MEDICLRRVFAVLLFSFLVSSLISSIIPFLSFLLVNITTLSTISSSYRHNLLPSFMAKIKTKRKMDIHSLFCIKIKAWLGDRRSICLKINIGIYKVAQGIPNIKRKFEGFDF